MPIYEFGCNDCHKEFSQLFLSLKDVKKVECQYCRSKNLKRLISCFSLHQTEESRLANFETSKPRGEDFYKDSRNIGLWAKKRMKEMGGDLGHQMDEIVERGRTGKILEDYNK